jgi:hypothetical protein
MSSFGSPSVSLLLMHFFFRFVSWLMRELRRHVANEPILLPKDSIQMLLLKQHYVIIRLEVLRDKILEDEGPLI